MKTGFQVEQSADNFITTMPWGVDLCKRLGLGDQLGPDQPGLPADVRGAAGPLAPPARRLSDDGPHAALAAGGHADLEPAGQAPGGVGVLHSAPRATTATRAWPAFVRRRLGREAFDRLVEPLVSAVYAADMEKLSVLATLPRFREMEREYGSLIRAMRRQMKNRPKPAEPKAAPATACSSRCATGCRAWSRPLPPGCRRARCGSTRRSRGSSARAMAGG